MRKLSIICPSLRFANFERMLSSIEDGDPGLDYSVVVITDNYHHEQYWQMIQHKPHIKLLAMRRRGIVHALNTGFGWADGEYIHSTSDDCVYQPRALSNMINFLYGFGDKLVIGDFVVEPHNPFEYFGRKFSPFPIMRKQHAKAIGGWMDWKFKSFYADPDLSLRCIDAGGEIAMCHGAKLYHPHNQDEIHLTGHRLHHAKDRAAFTEKWGHLGPVVDP